MSLHFKKACSMIIHANDIKIESEKYYYLETDRKKQKELKKGDFEEEGRNIYRDKITIIGLKSIRANINLKKFIRYCIELGNILQRRASYAIK